MLSVRSGICTLFYKHQDFALFSAKIKPFRKDSHYLKKKKNSDFTGKLWKAIT